MDRIIFSDSDVSRLWTKVRVAGANDCWPWIARSNRSRYGVLKITTDGAHWQIGAHRMALMLATGLAPPSNIQAIHSCDNPPCCNPAHLRWGTPKDNSADAWLRLRASAPPIFTGDEHYSRRNPSSVRKGEDVGTSILTERDVLRILRLHMKGKNCSEIAASTKRGVAVVSDVCQGKSWRHLHGTQGAPTLEQIKHGGVRRAKLSAAQIDEIKVLIANGMTNTAIAPLFGVSAAPISYIRNYGKTWR